MLVGMVADAAAAAHEHHADIGDVDHRHAVMPCPARQFEHAKTFARRPLRDIWLRSQGAQGTVRFSWVTSICSASLRRLAMLSIRRTISATASLRCVSVAARISMVNETCPGNHIGRAGHRRGCSRRCRPARPDRCGKTPRSRQCIPRHPPARRAAAPSAPFRHGRPCRSGSTASRVAPEIAVTTPTGRLSASSTGPCSM